MYKFALILALAYSGCNEQGDSRQTSKELADGRVNQPSPIGNGLDQNGSQAPSTPSAPSNPSPFETGERSTMAQCDAKGKVWVAVNTNSQNIPTCGKPSVTWGCCIEEINARFPSSAAKATEWNTRETGNGFELYACENAGNDQYIFHYAKPGSTRNAVEHKYMTFGGAMTTPATPSNCPIKPKLTDQLNAQLMRYQTPDSFVSSDDPMQSSDESEENPSNYPVYEMSSAGDMTHRKGRVKIVANIDFQTLKTSFYLNQTGTRAISGNYVKEVNKSLGGNNGKKEGVRSSQTELSDEESKNYKFILTNFLIYAKELKNVKGEVFNLSSPLPSIVSPGTRSRYDVFYGFPELKYETVVSGKIDTTINTVITRSVNEPNKVVIKIVHNIDDPSGKLYQSFPLPHSMEYTIDPVKKIILSIDTITYYHDSEGGGSKRYQTTNTSKTCKIISGSSTKSYDCK